MPDVWATFGELDAITQQRLAEVLETRGADPQQQAVRQAGGSHCRTRPTVGSPAKRRLLGKMEPSDYVQFARLRYRTQQALAFASVTCYGVYSSALATGSLPHCLGVQFASLSPPTLRTCPLGSRATAEPPTRGYALGPVAVHVPVAGE
jgi:hypothetical protein